MLCLYLQLPLLILFLQLSLLILFPYQPFNAVFARALGDQSGDKGGLFEPRYIALHEDVVFVAEKNKRRIQTLNKRTGKIDTIVDEHKGYEDKQLMTPVGIAVAGTTGLVRVARAEEEGWKWSREWGQINRFFVHSRYHSRFHIHTQMYVSDIENYCISVFTLTGSFVHSFARGSYHEIVTGKLYKPRGICLDPKEREIFVADCGKNRIQVFSADKGAFLRMWGAYEGSWSLNGPTDVKASSSGEEVFVADSNNNRICVFRPDGTGLRVLGEEKSKFTVTPPTP